MIEEEIRFRTSRGFRLSGLLLANDEGPQDVVVFAHGTGSSSASPRNRGIAERLLEAGIASFLFDFTGHGTSDGIFEQSTQDQQFDDLVSALDFLDEQSFVQPRFYGVNGSSTGGTVAVRAAAEDTRIQVMVLRVPRNLDITQFIPMVASPTLVLQGSADKVVLPEAREIYEALTCPKELRIVEGAKHLFEGKAHTETMVGETCRWFIEWFGRIGEID